jgi:transposase-like protein
MLQIMTRAGAFILTFPPGYRDTTDELSAAEFLEKMRWGSDPACVHCGSKKVTKVMDARTGERDKRMYWRCRGCYKRFNVRGGTLMESTRIPVHQWLRVLHLMSADRKLTGQDVRDCCQLSLKSSWYMLRRIRSGVFKVSEPWRTGAITLSRS